MNIAITHFGEETEYVIDVLVDIIYCRRIRQNGIFLRKNCLHTSVAFYFFTTALVTCDIYVGEILASGSTVNKV